MLDGGRGGGWAEGTRANGGKARDMSVPGRQWSDSAGVSNAAGGFSR